MLNWRYFVKTTSSFFLTTKSSVNIRKVRFRSSISSFGEVKTPLMVRNTLYQCMVVSNFSHQTTATGDTSIDEKEIEMHERYASEWWNTEGRIKGLHALNEIRIPLIRNGLINTRKIKLEDTISNPKYFSGFKMIEIGCGGGILCEALARLGADITGIDPSEILIDVAKKHAAENAHILKSPPTYLNTNIEDHSTHAPELYDVVVASEVIEHIDNKELFLEYCLKTLKPGGSIFLTTPSKTIVSWLLFIVLAEYILRRLPIGVHSWDKFISPAELSNMLEKLGCKTILVNGITYSLMFNKWTWKNSNDVHYTLHAVKLNTLSSLSPAKESQNLE